MKKILVKIGPDGVEVYKENETNRELIIQKEIAFSDNFNEIRGLNFNDEEALVRLLERVSANYFDCKIEAEASEFFRHIKPSFLVDLKKEIKRRAKIEIDFE